ncbi:MAG TPA: GntR family transcriptional regulator [Clostridia bacterium]|nr:GntR family transcriptional regulator [Clostridia bacterium]
MIMSLDFESDIPIYLQIKMQIIEGIASGKLKQGEPLPSVRQFAADLGINLHTVNKAYTYLKQDGFIIVHRQKGVVVNPGEGPGITDGYMGELKAGLKPIISEAYCRGMKSEEFNEICIRLFNELSDGGVKK